MKRNFDPLLFNLIILFLVASPKRWIQAETNPKVSSITPGEALVSHRASISFEGSLNPAIVHSYAEKMKWSKPRHYKHDGAGRDLPPPPSLAHTVAKRLSNQVFTSLFSKLPYEHAKKVFERKNAGGLPELEPSCEVAARTTDRSGSRGCDVLDDSADSDTGTCAEEHLIQQQHPQDTLELCLVNFASLYSFYGISFNFTLSFNNKLMDDLSLEDMVSRVTPDHRGWTQSISDTDMSVSVELCSPDFVTYSPPKDGRVRMAGNGNVSRESIEIDERNVEEAVQALLKKSKVVLGLPHVQNLLIRQEGEFIIVPSTESQKDEDADLSHQTGAMESTPMVADNELMPDDELMPEDELIPEILHLCQKYELSEEECRNTMKALELDNDDESNKSESPPNNSHDDLQEMSELDIIRLMDTRTTTSDIHDIDRNWDLPMEDVLQLREDMISIERLIDDTSMG